MALLESLYTTDLGFLAFVQCILLRWPFLPCLNTEHLNLHSAPDVQ